MAVVTTKTQEQIAKKRKKKIAEIATRENRNKNVALLKKGGG